MTTVQLQLNNSRMKRKVVKLRRLTKQRTEIDERIQKVSKDILLIGTQFVGNKRGPKFGTTRYRQEPVIVYIKKCVKPGEKVTAPVVAERVLEAGYKTNNKDHFASSIGYSMRIDREIKKVARGKFIYHPRHHSAQRTG